MEFCPDCGSMLLPTGDNCLKCSCRYAKKLNNADYEVKEKLAKKSENIVVNEEFESLDLLYSKDAHLKSYDWARRDWG